MPKTPTRLPRVPVVRKHHDHAPDCKGAGQDGRFVLYSPAASSVHTSLRCVDERRRTVMVRDCGGRTLCNVGQIEMGVGPESIGYTKTALPSHTYVHTCPHTAVASPSQPDKLTGHSCRVSKVVHGPPRGAIDTGTPSTMPIDTKPNKKRKKKEALAHAIPLPLYRKTKENP